MCYEQQLQSLQSIAELLFITEYLLELSKSEIHASSPLFPSTNSTSETLQKRGRERASNPLVFLATLEADNWRYTLMAR